MAIENLKNGVDPEKASGGTIPYCPKSFKLDSQVYPFYSCLFFVCGIRDRAFRNHG